jgi:aminopeptidase N
MVTPLSAALLMTCATIHTTVSLHAQQPGTDVLRYTFAIALPDTGARILGEAQIELTRGPGAPDSLYLDLVGATVTHVSLPYRYDGRRLAVAAPRGPLTLRVAWNTTPADGLIARPNSFFGDNWPDRARHWLPTIDHPSDKALVAWEIDAPDRWRVIAVGGFRDTVRSAPARLRWRYATAHPVPTYTMVLGAREMTVSRHARVEVWSYPQDSAFADRVPFRRASRMLDVMERLVGPFPYERLAHVQSSTRYGGMENATAIFYADRGWSRGTMGEGVVRHETAHQWFGDAVTARDWHHVWLSEGFATYFDAVMAQQLDGDTAYWRVLHDDRAGYLRSRVVDRPIIDTTITDPNDLLNANSYQKGAWVLHMLRREVGDSAFFRGVRAYYARWRDSTALSSDFQREIERAAGRDLSWFFRQWLWQPGYARLDVTWAWQRGAVVLTVRQAGPARFRITAVPVAFGAARAAFDLEPRAVQVVRIPLAAPPPSVAIDPDATLLLTAEVRR